MSHALYEWDYPRQLLELRMLDAVHALDRGTARRELYSEAFLIKRPLLQAIDPARTRPAVLLIDEIDRADEEFEGFLLELLAELDTIPELGTVRATTPLVNHVRARCTTRSSADASISGLTTLIRLAIRERVRRRRRSWLRAGDGDGAGAEPST